jgi:hypothetical protein
MILCDFCQRKPILFITRRSIEIIGSASKLRKINKNQKQTLGFLETTENQENQ